MFVVFLRRFSLTWYRRFTMHIQYIIDLQSINASYSLLIANCSLLTVKKIPPPWVKGNTFFVEPTTNRRLSGIWNSGVLGAVGFKGHWIKSHWKMCTSFSG